MEKNPTFYDKPKKCCHNFFRNKSKLKIDTKIGIVWSSQVPNVGFMTAKITGMIDASTKKNDEEIQLYMSHLERLEPCLLHLSPWPAVLHADPFL